MRSNKRPDKSNSVNSSQNEPSNPPLDKKGQEELYNFVKRKRKDAFEYFKFLKEEITKTDRSRTRHLYLVWAMLIVFELLDSKAVEMRFIAFNYIDQTVVLRILPALLSAAYYVALSRFFILRERLGVYEEIAKRLFPGEYYPFSTYIRPVHFMLSERLLNLYRPQIEILSNNFMLGLILTALIYIPAIAIVYDFYVINVRFGIEDGLTQASTIIGAMCFIQALVMMRGIHVMSKQDRLGSKEQKKVSK